MGKKGPKKWAPQENIYITRIEYFSCVEILELRTVRKH